MFLIVDRDGDGGSEETCLGLNSRSAVCGELVRGLLEKIEVMDDCPFQVGGRDRRLLGDKAGEF